jgi:hypothetical protein
VLAHGSAPRTLLGHLNSLLDRDQRSRSAKADPPATVDRVGRGAAMTLEQALNFRMPNGKALKDMSDEDVDALGERGNGPRKRISGVTLSPKGAGRSRRPQAY